MITASSPIAAAHSSLSSTLFSGPLAKRVGATPLRHIDLGHAKVAHRSIGSGPDLLFVHGWPLTSATYREIVPTLAERFRCHLIDLPGAGLSEWGPASKIDLRAHADAVIEVVRRLELAQVVLVAHDSGGVFARECAAALPERVRGLVMGNTEIPGHHSLLLVPYLALGKLRRPGRWMTALMGRRWFRRSKLAFGACFQDVGAIDDEFTAHFVTPLEADPRLGEGQTRLLQGLTVDVVDGLAQTHARIQCPTRLIWGSEDPFFPAAKMRGMLGQFGAEVSVREIPGAKLFVHEEHPAIFAAEIASFCDALEPRVRRTA